PAGWRAAADLQYAVRWRGERDLLQSVELVCRPAVSQLRTAADPDRAEEQGSHIRQYQPRRLHLADHRSPGLSILLQRTVLFVSAAVAPQIGHDDRDRERRRPDGGRSSATRGRIVDPACAVWLPEPRM